MPRTAIWIVLLSLTLATERAAAAEAVDPCPAQSPAAAVRVHTSHATPQVTYEHSAREIRRRLGARGGGVTLGMTQTSTAVSIDLVVQRGASREGGPGCARPQISVSLSHDAVEILLASEIQHDACVADAVLNHEMVHVAIEHETLDWAGRTIEAQMQEEYRERVLAGDEAQVRAQLAQEFEQRWAPALEAMLGMAQLKHAEHDERDSYADKDVCAGALMRIARSIE